MTAMYHGVRIVKRLAIAALLLLTLALGTLAVHAQGVTPCPGGQSWDEFAAGEAVRSFDWGEVGVTLDVVPNRSQDGPGTVFDSHCSVPGGCTGGDDDLSTSAGCNPTNRAPRAKVLVCQDGDVRQVGDSPSGCSFVFNFDRPIGLGQFGFLDVEQAGSWIRMTDSQGDATQCAIPPGAGQCDSPHDTSVGNNSWQSVACVGIDVVKLEIYLDGSGAITDLCRLGPTPVVVTGFAARGGSGAMALIGATCAVAVLAGAGLFVVRGRGGRESDPPA